MAYLSYKKHSGGIKTGALIKTWSALTAEQRPIAAAVT